MAPRREPDNAAAIASALHFIEARGQKLRTKREQLDALQDFVTANKSTLRTVYTDKRKVNRVLDASLLWKVLAETTQSKAKRAAHLTQGQAVTALFRTGSDFLDTDFLRDIGYSKKTSSQVADTTASDPKLKTRRTLRPIRRSLHYGITKTNGERVRGTHSNNSSRRPATKGHRFVRGASNNEGPATMKRKRDHPPAAVFSDPGRSHVEEDDSLDLGEPDDAGSDIYQEDEFTVFEEEPAYQDGVEYQSPASFSAGDNLLPELAHRRLLEDEADILSLSISEAVQRLDDMIDEAAESVFRGNKGTKPAKVSKSVSHELLELYRYTLGQRIVPAVAALSDCGALSARRFFHALVWAYLHKQLLSRDKPVPWPSPLQLRAGVHPAAEYLSLQVDSYAALCKQAAADQIHDQAFQINILAPLAESMADDTFMILKEHADQARSKAGWQAALHHRLRAICEVALLLKGMLAASETPQLIACFPFGEEFDGMTMDWAEGTAGDIVGFTVMPGVVTEAGLDEEESVTGLAVVVCYKGKKDVDASFV